MNEEEAKQTLEEHGWTVEDMRGVGVFGGLRDSTYRILVEPHADISYDVWTRYRAIIRGRL